MSDSSTSLSPSPRGVGLAWLQRVWRRFWFGGVWLIFMFSPLRAIIESHSTLKISVGVASFIAFATLYLWATRYGRMSLIRGRNIRMGWVTVVVMCLLVALITSSAGPAGLVSLTYVCVVALFLLPPVSAWLTVLLVGGSCLAIGRWVPGWSSAEDSAISIAFASIAVFAIISIVTRNTESIRERETQALLQMQNERDRIARDVHDVLGHSLTVISVKAELAARLAELGPEHAERLVREVQDIQNLSRTALAETRSTVAGTHTLSLARELSGARTSLAAANIEADLPRSIDDVPAELRELFAWVVREGVTNVIRHSTARICTISISHTMVEVRNDGGSSDVPYVGAAGTGLVGLASRAASARAHLTYGPLPATNKGGPSDTSFADGGYLLTCTTTEAAVSAKGANTHV